MKFLVIAGLALAFFASCQTTPKGDDYFTRQKIRADEYKARIKAEKRRQAELDLPYRIIDLDQKIESIAFVAGTDKAPSQPVWAHIEKNRPTVALMLADSGVSALDPAYRSVREKVPFLAVSNDAQKPVTEFLRAWPYVKNLTGSNEDIYHALTFGEKKDTLKAIMLDSFKMDEAQWQWLGSELNDPAAVAVLVSAKSLGGTDREKFLSLVKKSKQKMIVLLTTGGERTTVSKTSVNGIKIFELSPQSGQTELVALSLSSDAPMQVAKPADFAYLRFDWSSRVAVLEVRTSADEKIEAVEASF